MELNHIEAEKRVAAGEMTPVEEKMPIKAKVEIEEMPQEVVEPEENAEEVGEEYEDVLENLHIDQLKELAKEKGIKGFALMKKETLIKRLS
ncbi:MAG: hypothetical protein GY861_18425 [bacterium]|nr:hypothetical protein [bacterium]